MAISKKEDQNLDDCYQELFQFMNKLLEKYDAQMVAGTMVAQALRLYKSSLDKEGFDKMVGTIGESGPNIRPYEKPHIH